MENPQAITYLGTTNFRSPSVKFGIKAIDRARHMYVIGKSGTGKSTFIENMAIQDIQAGNGLAVLDPHGGTADKLLEYIPEWRRNDVIYFAPFDTEFPISFNVMEDPGDADKRTKVADGLLSAFKKIWVDAWSARMEYILLNTVLALLEYPDSTLLSINRMLTDKDFRKSVVSHITNHSVKAFWIDEYGKWDPKYANEAGAAIQNKIGQFVANPIIRNMIGQPKSSIDFRQIMDGRKIFIANLSKGRMGDQNSGLIGAMIITKIYLAAMSRAELAPQVMSRMPSFFFYADEFQNFANDSFTNILSEARKYKLCLTLAHQYVNQLPETLRDAIVGNVGSMVIFRIGPDDAELFEKQFSPVFVAEDFTNLGFRQMYMSISIDGTASKPFSAMSLDMMQNTADGVRIRQEVTELSRQQYTQSREGVEQAISNFYNSKTTAAKPVPDAGAPAQFVPRDKAPALLALKVASATAPQPHPSRVSFQKMETKPVTQKPKPIPPPPPVKRPEPQFSSELSKMIQAFDNPEKANDIVIPEKPKVELPKPEAKKFISLQGGAARFVTKETTQPSKTIVSPVDKSAPVETKTSLKDTIAKILSEKKTAPPAASEKKNETPSEPPQQPEVVAAPVIQVPIEVTQTEKAETPIESSYQKSQTKREVPEDVLRKIFA
jgi:hypothetical protein